MSPSSSFLRLPLDIRHEVYSYILIIPSVPTVKDLDLSILFVNRLINEEATDYFYSRNLFTVVESNGFASAAYAKSIPGFFAIQTASKFPVDKVTMRVQFLYCVDTSPAETSPNFVLARSALHRLGQLFSGDKNVVSSNIVASFSLHNHFRNTHERLETVMFDQWIGLNGLYFAGVLTDSSVSRMARSKLSQCISKLHRMQLFDKLYGKGRIQASQDMHNLFFEAASNRYAIIKTWADMVWECHLGTILKSSVDLLNLWTITMENIDDLTNAIWRQARSAQVPVAEKPLLWGKVRELCEEAIRSVNGPAMSPSSSNWASLRNPRKLLTPGADLSDGSTSTQVPYNFFKSMISYRASRACEELGDYSSAIEYRLQAADLDPKSKKGILNECAMLREKAGAHTEEARVEKWCSGLEAPRYTDEELKRILGSERSSE